MARMGLDKELEYLDHDEDIFYKTGVYGYKTKGQANERAHAYKLQERLFVISPAGTKYSPTRKPAINANYLFDNIIHLDAHVRFTQDLDAKHEFYTQTRDQLMSFISDHGVWSLSSVLHTKKLFELITTYEIFSATELRDLIKYGNGKA